MTPEMLADLEAWRLGQYTRVDESDGFSDYRKAHESQVFLRKWHQEIANPWRGFLTPEERAASLHHPVLVKNARGEVSIAILNEHNGQGIFRWMEIP